MLFKRFHVFGDDPDSQRPTQLDHRTDDIAAIVVLQHFPGQRAVELDRAELEAADVKHRAVTHAEVVHLQMNAHALQPLERTAGNRVVGDVLRLGQFQAQRRCLQAVRAQAVFDERQ